MSSSCCTETSKIIQSNFESVEKLREAVRDHYANIVTLPSQSNQTSCENGNSCFGPSTDPNYAAKLGYSKEDLDSVPDNSNLGLGCGNPVIFAQLKEGDTVVDLGSGAGFDVFIAARKVGLDGKVIGVDMTPQMISKARTNALKRDYKNVEFRLGEIEYLPIGDGTVDVIISNCVINLVPEPNKSLVFLDAFRVLRSKGRICISDVVTDVIIPEDIKADLAKHAGCLNGATFIPNLKKYLQDAGFIDIKITPKDESKEFIKTWAPNYSVTDLIVSALIEAKKP